MSAAVTQADREVLKAIYAPAAHEAIDAGDYDSHQDARAIARHRSEAVEELVEVLATLAEAARNACDARQHPSLTEALFDADALISKHRGEQG